MSSRTNSSDSNLNVQARERYNGSPDRPTPGERHALDEPLSRDGENLELQEITPEVSRVSWSSLSSSIRSSRTPPQPTSDEPETVMDTTPNTVPDPRELPLPTAPETEWKAPQKSNESLRYIRFRWCVLPSKQPADDFGRRALHDYHISLIAISAVIGMGYYVRTGTLLHVGGEAAVVYTYSFLGILAFMVMKNLTTMLKIWPVGGALIVFVEEFVDKDVAKSVAFLYWYYPNDNILRVK